METRSHFKTSKCCLVTINDSLLFCCRTWDVISVSVGTHLSAQVPSIHKMTVDHVFKRCQPGLERRRVYTDYAHILITLTYPISVALPSLNRSVVIILCVNPLTGKSYS